MVLDIILFIGILSVRFPSFIFHFLTCQVGWFLV
ncbi:hypothetical protein VPHD51_0069 [Vibrio phage D51]